MSPLTAVIILSTLIVHFSCSHLSQLTKQQFEDAFDTYKFGDKPAKEIFHTFPHSSFIFEKKNVESGELVVPIYECHILLRRSGIGAVHYDCGMMLKEYQLKDKTIPNFIIPYRCFKSDNPYDYELKNVPIDDMEREFQGWAVYFTPDTVDGCHPPWSTDAPLNTMINYMQQDEEWQSFQEQPGLAVSKEQYEAAFVTEAQKKMYKSAPYYTFLFQSSFSEPKTWQAVDLCLVSIFGKGTGVITLGCAEFIKLFKKIDDTFRYLLLPYRCFLNKNPREYELHNATIDKIQLIDIGEDIEFGREQYLLFFTPSAEAEHCSTNWGEDRTKEFAHDEL